MEVKHTNLPISLSLPLRSLSSAGATGPISKFADSPLCDILMSRDILETLPWILC